MLEFFTINREDLNTKDQIIIDLLKDGRNFLEQFGINRTVILEVISMINRFLRINGKIPHNLFKFLISAYYIITRHPITFPLHDSKKKFCRKFGLQPNSLDYCVEKILRVLNIIKILDDKNYPYFLDSQNDIYYDITRDIVKAKVEKVRMNFLLYNQPINSQILSEDLVAEIIFEKKIFPEELFRQFYEIIFELVEKELRKYREYVQLQQKYFI